MTRIAIFEDAIAACQEASASCKLASAMACEGVGDVAKYEREAYAQVSIALEKVNFLMSELGLGDDPSDDPMTLTDPLAE